MTKQIAVCLLFVIGMINVNAQNSTQEVKGSNFVNAGIGIGAFGFYGTGGIPIVAQIEHGFTDKISAGINFGIISRTYDAYTKYSYVVFGVRGSYHVNQLLNVNDDKVDLYAGVGLLYRHFSVKYNGLDAYGGVASSGAVDLDLHAGGRYFFSKNFGAYAEVGYGISPLELGITLKF